MPDLDSRVKEAVDAVVEVMKQYDSSSPPRWDKKTVHGVLRNATRDIVDPEKFKEFATALKNKIEERVNTIKQDFKNNQYLWFLNFSNESYFESVILDFRNLTRGYPEVRALSISILTSAEFDPLYLRFVDWLHASIVSKLKNKTSVEDIPEVKILCEQWYSVARYSSLIGFHREMLQNVIYKICDEIKDREIKTSFIRYVDNNTRQRDDATPNRPLFQRPAMPIKPFQSKLEELSTRVDTLWLRLENEMI
jgi:hypothetical protein